jgi:hypothetical protein
MVLFYYYFKTPPLILLIFDWSKPVENTIPGQSQRREKDVALKPVGF